MRLDGQHRHSRRLAPHSIVIARTHAKRISTMRQICVERRPPRPCIHPVAVESLQLVSVLHLLRRHKTQPRIVEFVVAVPWRHPQVFHRSLRCIIHAHSLNRDLRRYTIHRHVFRIDPRNPLQRRKPQRPIAQTHGCRMAAAAAFADAHPIRHAKAHHLRSRPALRHAIEIVASRTIHAGVRANPQ